MKRRVLVVDDDRLMVKTLTEILELQGWEVGSAYDGRRAVEAVAERAYEVVLMDVKMPGMDGVEAFRVMKAARPGVKVVLMTAFTAQERLTEAEEHGVVQVLSKPVDIRSLLALLTQTVSEARSVLLVDGDRAFLKTLSEVLALRGFQTVIASSLMEAMRSIEEKRPAAILLHMHLGATSAREAVVAVHNVSPEIALILYSGQPGADREINGSVPREYVHSYLQKPFPIDKVTGVLSEVLGG